MTTTSTRREFTAPDGTLHFERVYDDGSRVGGPVRRITPTPAQLDDLSTIAAELRVASRCLKAAAALCFLSALFGIVAIAAVLLAA